jgi:hypothetical protein
VQDKGDNLVVGQAVNENKGRPLIADGHFPEDDVEIFIYRHPLF